MKDEKVIDDTFVVHKTLGQGFTSKVVLAEHRDTGYKLAIKIFKPIHKMKLMVENFRKEVDSMKNFKHPNLINIIAANENGIYCRSGKKDNIMYLGIELAENAELFDFIADAGYGFKETMARALFKQLLAGLSSMHNLKVAHRDLKTENLFLDNNFNLKVGDFGFSKFMDPEKHDGKLKTQLGTSGYQSPELVEGHMYSGEANDIFACGVILFILVNAYPPFREARKTDNWYRHIYYDKAENFWALHSKKNKCSTELKELISGMLKYKNRWTIKDIEDCAWMKGGLPNKEEYMEDMNARKKKVDARREAERLEQLRVDSDSSGSGQYRGEDEEVLIENLYKQLEANGVDTYPVNKLEDDLPKNFFKFKGTDILATYKYLISLLVNEQGTVQLDEGCYSLSAEVPFASDELTDENEKECPKIKFYASLCVDDNTQSTIVEVIKDSSTEYYEFKKFLTYMNEKAAQI